MHCTLRTGPPCQWTVTSTELKEILALESQDYLVRACFVILGPMASLHSYVPHVGCGAVIYGRRHEVFQPENGGGQWVLNSVEEKGPKWNILPQNDPNWNTGIRKRDQIGIQ